MAVHPLRPGRFALRRPAIAAVNPNTPAPTVQDNGASAGRETAIKELESAVSDYKTALLARPDDNDGCGRGRGGKGAMGQEKSREQQCENG